MRSIAGLALLLLVACDRSPTAPANKLLVTAFATPDTVLAGSTTSVIIAITNVSNQPQPYVASFCGPVYHIFDSAGAQVDTTAYFCADDYLAPPVLAPGAQATFAAEWTTTLAPGQYTIRGALTGDGIENIPYPVWIAQAHHSARITSIGSTRAARHAGIHDATSAAATSTTHPPA